MSGFTPFRGVLGWVHTPFLDLKRTTRNLLVVRSEKKSAEAIPYPRKRCCNDQLSKRIGSRQKLVCEPQGFYQNVKVLGRVMDHLV